MSQTRHVWCRDLLVLLKCPGTLENAVALVAQCQAEGGTARFNPLNCTVKAKGSTDYNSVLVQNYASYLQGLSVTAGMFHQANMKPLLAALQKGDSAATYWAALPGKWGTHHPAGYSNLSWLADVRKHWYDRAMILISGT